MAKNIHLTHDGVLVVDGKEYVQGVDKMKKIDGIDHVDKTTFMKFNRKEHEKKVKFISKKISKVVKVQDLIFEVMKNKGRNEINKLYEVLKKVKDEKKEIKVQEGCLGLKILSGKPKEGGRYIQLVD